MTNRVMRDFDAGHHPPPAGFSLGRFGPAFLVIVFLFVALVAYEIYASLLTARVSAATEAKNLSLVIEAKLNSDFDAAERNVADMAADVDREAMRPELARRHGARITHWLKSQVRDISSASALRFFDASGNLIHSSIDGDTPLNIVDRDYFRQLKANPAGPAIFSPVIVGRTTRRAAMVIARAVSDRDGTFLGVALSAIDMTALRDQLRSIDLGADGVVALRRLENGALVVRYPGPIEVDNQPAPDIPVLQAILRDGPAGALEVVSPLDGIRRIYGYRTIGRFPFFVAVGIADTSYLAEWRHNATILVFVSLLFLGVLAGMFRWLAAAEARHRKAERHLAEAQSLAKLGSWHVVFGASDAEDVWTISPELRRLYGHADDAPIGTDTGFAVMPPEDQEATARLWAAAKRGEGPTQWEHRIIVHGAVKWVQVWAKFEFGADGRAISANGTNQDITARKIAEARIDRLLREQRAILDSHVVGIVTVENRVIKWANEAFAAMFGYSGAEIVGLPTRALYSSDQDHADFAAQALPILQRGEIYRTELRQVRKDGSSGWYQISCGTLDPVSDEQIGAFVDITERKRFEEALIDREARLRGIFLALAEGLVVQDANGRVVDANPAAEEILGLTRDQILGKTSVDPHWQAIYENGAPYPGELHPAMLTLRTGQAQRDQIMGIRVPGRGLRWISINSNPIGGEDGTAPGAVAATFMDITEHLGSVAQLREAKERLEKLAAEQAAHLRELAGELTEAEQRERDRLYALLHDDMQPLLVAVRLSLSSLGERTPLADCLRVVADAREHIGQVIQAARTLSLQLNPPLIREHGLNPALESLARWVGDNYGLRVDLTLAPETEPEDVAVRLLCFNAVRELITNVAKHAGTGHVSVRLQRAAADHLRIAVADDGSGFDPGNIASGSGLAMLEYRLGMFGGSLRIDSRPGLGTIVVLSVPLRLAQGSARRPRGRVGKGDRNDAENTDRG